MYVKKNYNLRETFFNSGKHLFWLTPYALLIALLYRYTALHEFSLPWLPLSLIGTAVTFYVGFKNNQAYDRLWEARTVWGGIVNSSRMWGSNIKAFVVPAASSPAAGEGLPEQKRALIYRHIAWLYQLRRQLLEPTAWEHISLPGVYRRDAEEKSQKMGLGLFGEDVTEDRLQRYLSSAEQAALPTYKNAAAQLIDQQSEHLARLRKAGHVGDVEHVALQGILNDFYEHQGKAERIKKTPFPRQFASFGFVMVCIFIAMLPFGFFSEFAKIGDNGIWLAVPFVILISWVYVVMELVGDYSENPFEGLANDVPMLALSRTIEIDLLQQLGETDLPAPIQPINHVLL
ncbi:bestrophin family protein [Hymenobacter sp. DG01]|uniref:bestrophin family protein n=1 Tax=Hymenobacter sp. DG01 TaxID=2584940 RepID=UPI00111E0AEC|nr:bestrophin family ion channel [Hymenobacter sp. DG01]